MRTIACSILGYLFLLLTVRLLARRPGAQMTPFEFVLVFLIGGVIILGTVGNDHSMTNCFCAVITVSWMHRAVSAVRQRFPRLGAIIDGTPLVLIEHGRWKSDTMRKMRLQDTDVMAAARTKNVASLEQIAYAILERNGSISIIQADN